MDHAAPRVKLLAMRKKHRAGFTLIELMVVIMLAALLMTLALPSIDGLFREQALQAKLDAFTQLIQRARWQAIEQQAPVRVIWEEEQVAIRAALNAKEASQAASLKFGPAQFKLNQDENLSLSKQNNLEQASTSDSWTFWPSGNCEPTTVSYAGPEGTWTLAFDPLSAQHRIEQFELP